MFRVTQTPALKLGNLEATLRVGAILDSFQLLQT